MAGMASKMRVSLLVHQSVKNAPSALIAQPSPMEHGWDLAIQVERVLRKSRQKSLADCMLRSARMLNMSCIHTRYDVPGNLFCLREKLHTRRT